MSKPPYSLADYTPANLAKSMESFHFMLNGRGEINNGQGFSLCNMTFIYDTVKGVKDDPNEPHERVVLRRHPACSQPLRITHL